MTQDEELKDKTDLALNGFVTIQNIPFIKMIQHGTKGMTAYGIYLYLYAHIYKGDQYCFVPYSKIIDNCHISKGTLLTALKLLEQEGIIVIKTGSNEMGANEYYFPYENRTADTEKLSKIHRRHGAIKPKTRVGKKFDEKERSE